MYSAQVAEHIANPRNVGEIERPSGVADVTNEVCQDRIKLSIQIESERIVNAKVKASGCPPTIAAASALTELIVGLTVTGASKLSREDVVRALGSLPAAKMHCAALAIEALRMAIDSSRTQ